MANTVNVMVVDDSILARNKIKRYLSASDKYDFQVITEAGNGLDAITKFKKHQPDLVTLDLVMPEMDGMKALDILIKIKPDIKVIVISSSLSKNKISMAIQKGAKNFCLKPFDQSAFLKVVENSCE